MQKWSLTRMLVVACLVVLVMSVAFLVPQYQSKTEQGLRQSSGGQQASTVDVEDEVPRKTKEAKPVSVPEPEEEDVVEADGAKDDVISNGTVDDDIKEPSGMPDGDFVVSDDGSEESSDTVQPSEGAPAFVMADDATYEENEVLVSVPEGTDVQQIVDSLGDAAGNVSVDEVSEGTVRLSYDGGLEVETAVNDLLESSVVESAQPNYTYVLMSDSMEPASGEQDAVADAQEETSAITGQANPAVAEVGDSKETTAPEKDAAQTNDASRADQMEAVEETDNSQNPTEAKAEGEPQSTSEDNPKPMSDTEPTDESSEDSLEAQAASVNDSRVGEQWSLKSINAFDAWSLVKANHGVTVATFDLGCDVNHPDLKDNIVDPYNAYNAVKRGSTTDVTPYRGSPEGHGTHVAGIIAATANNGIGVAGVSYNANLMPIKVVGPDGTASTSSLIKAYDYVIEHKDSRNCRIVNLSMGIDKTASSDDTLLKKIDEAYAKGIVTVAAAGNSSSSKSKTVPYNCYPSDHSNVVSVINLKQSGTEVVRSSGSNYNEAGTLLKNISAPGTDILSTKGSSYGTLTGTSMAAPHVSGVLALMFAERPSLSADDAVSLLYATATDLKGSTMSWEYGWGEVNAYAAVNAIRNGLTQAQQSKLSEVLNQNDKIRAYEVMERIDQIPSIDGLTLASTSRVTEARNAYDALTPSQQALVSNYAKLTAAEERLNDLANVSQIEDKLQYQTHVQREGWQDWKKNGQTSGTTGESLRLEGIRIKIDDAPYSGTIQYRTHVQTYGWENSWKSSGEMSGTQGESKRLEAIQIKLTEGMAEHYDIWYRVHAQKYGWMGWTKNGGLSGTAGYSYRLEGIEIRILSKGSSAPGSTDTPFRFPVSYRTHVQRQGWQAYARDGEMSGTSGQSLRLEGININVSGSPYSGSIRYRTHVQTYGWQGYSSNGEMSGTTGQSKRLEAIEIDLTDDLANHFDVWYRVHAQRLGWMGWTNNGGSAGTAGYSLRLEAIQIQLVPKGGPAPGDTSNAFVSR